MTINPDTVREVLKGATGGPWRYCPDNKAIYGGSCDVIIVYENQMQFRSDGPLIAMAPDLAAEVLRLSEVEAENARLREALAECCAEIDGYIWQEYPLDHPAHERRRNLDLSANPARAALAEKGDT